MSTGKGIRPTDIAGAGESAADRFRRLEEIFLSASDMEPAARNAYLQRVCGDDAELLADVQRLLGLEETAEARIDGAVAAVADILVEGEELPERVGRYRVLGRLGSGGFGSVWLAERDDEHFQKRVALKLVRPEMWSPELEERLRQERQILAGLDHPNIARILDGGATDGGGAYLVMELVEGAQTLMEFCHCRGLDIEQRLELFRTVCDAVQHAHQRLILHCDLKPANILVGADGVPKLLDFGIAKALQESSADRDVGLTAGGRRPLTPEYASPEQVRYQTLTTASDIYSLGVILFELLSGDRPYRFESSDPLSVARVVAEVEPPTASSHYLRQQGQKQKRPAQKSSEQKPSERKHRRKHAPWGRDLDAIVAQALRKEPSRRYGSAEQLSEDVRRYLEFRPVGAQLHTPFYRLSKLVRRNRLAVGLGVALVSTLIGATITTTFQARRAEASRIVAEGEKERAEEVVDLLVGLFEVSDPALSKGSEITAREVLDQGSRSIRRGLEGRPRLRAALSETLGRVYRELGVYNKAELHLSESLDLRREILDPGASEVVQSLYHLALLRIEELRFEDAEELLDRAMREESRLRGTTPAFARLLRSKALSRLERGRPQEADDLVEQALAALPTSAASSDSDSTLEHADLWDLGARSAYQQGDFDRSVALNERGLATRRKILGSLHPRIATSLHNLSAALQARGELDAARDLLEEALEMRTQLYGRRHGAVALALHNLATVDLAQGHLERSESLLREALDIFQEIHGPDHVRVADTLSVLALIESDTDAESAAEMHRRALGIRLKTLGEEHPDTAQSYLGLGDALRGTDPAATLEAYRRALELQRSYLPPSDYRVAFTLERLGSLRCREVPEDGVQYYRDAYRIRSSQLGESHWQTALGRARLGRCLISVDPAEALGHLEASVVALTSSLGAEDPRTLRAAKWLSRAQDEQ